MKIKHRTGKKKREEGAWSVVVSSCRLGGKIGRKSGQGNSWHVYR